MDFSLNDSLSLLCAISLISNSSKLRVSSSFVKYSRKSFVFPLRIRKLIVTCIDLIKYSSYFCNNKESSELIRVSLNKLNELLMKLIASL